MGYGALHSAPVYGASALRGAARGGPLSMYIDRYRYKYRYAYTHTHTHTYIYIYRCVCVYRHRYRYRYIDVGLTTVCAELSSCAQGYAADAWGMALCILHLFTGRAPYEELLSAVHCPAELREALEGVWSSDDTGGVYAPLGEPVYLLFYLPTDRQTDLPTCLVFWASSDTGGVYAP